MSDILDQLKSLRLVPVIALDDASQANPLADALAGAGLPCAEITLRTPSALDSIRALKDRTDILVGAGTVHSAEQAASAVEAGACFIISPGFNLRTVTWCQENDVPIYPGISSPTDLESAMEAGLKVVKFFPAESLGGAKMLKALVAPYHEMTFIPTGGINTGNLADYLAISQVAACGGSWMVSKDLLKAGDFDTISKLTSEAVALAKSC